MDIVCYRLLDVTCTSIYVRVKDYVSCLEIKCVRFLLTNTRLRIICGEICLIGKIDCIKIETAIA